LSLRSFLVTPSRARRELLIFLSAAVVGLAVLPPLIFLGGARAFGPYAGGGLAALLGNYLHGLASGSLGFWTVAAAPYLIVLVARLTLSLARRSAPH